MKYTVGAGAFGIYAGILDKQNKKWKSKSNVTEEALESVRDYLIYNCLDGFEQPKQGQHGYSWMLKDGREVKLLVEIDNNKT